MIAGKKHGGAAEGLWLLDQGADQMAVVDNALAWSVTLVMAPRHAQHRRRPEMADQPIVINLYLQAAADQARGHGVEDVAHRDRARTGHADGGGREIRG